MGFDIAVTEEAFEGNEDRSWAKSRLGFNTCRSRTLDVSAFLPAHVADKGAIPSGTFLAEVGGGSTKLGPWDPAGAADCVGVLFNTTKVGRGDGTDLATAADIGVPVMWQGIVDVNKLPVFAGTDLGQFGAAAVEDLPQIRFED